MGEFIRMTMSDGADIAVYHALAEGERRGGVVLVQEIFGVTDHIRDLAEEYAGDGYEVLAPALFDREHPGFEAGYDAEGLAEGVRLAREAHPFDLSLADVQTCVDALAAKGPVFVVGYCYGGDADARGGGGLRLLRQPDSRRGGRGAEGAGGGAFRPLRFGHSDGRRGAAGGEGVAEGGGACL